MKKQIKLLKTEIVMKKIVFLLSFYILLFFLGCTNNSTNRVEVNLNLDIYQSVTEGNVISFEYSQTINVDSTYKIISIDLLVSIAAIGALIIGEFWEAAAVTFLFILGDFLETKTLEKTRHSIQSILKLAPTSIRIIEDNKDVDVKLFFKGEDLFNINLNVQ